MIYASIIILLAVVILISFRFISRETDKQYFPLWLGIQILLTIILYKLSIRTFVGDGLLVQKEWVLNVIFIILVASLGIVNRRFISRLSKTEKVNEK